MHLSFPVASQPLFLTFRLISPNKKHCSIKVRRKLVLIEIRQYCAQVLYSSPVKFTIKPLAVSVSKQRKCWMALRLQWIPSYFGIAENEIANSLVKSAHGNESTIFLRRFVDSRRPLRGSRHAATLFQRARLPRYLSPTSSTQWHLIDYGAILHLSVLTRCNNCPRQQWLPQLCGSRRPWAPLSALSAKTRLQTAGISLRLST